MLSVYLRLLAGARRESGNGSVEYLFLLTSVIFGATLGLNALGSLMSAAFSRIALRLSGVLG